MIYDIHSHVLVEKLLQLLIDIVDANLFESIVVEELEAGDVEDTDVGDLLHGGVAQGLVTLVHLWKNTMLKNVQFDCIGKKRESQQR